MRATCTCNHELTDILYNQRAGVPEYHSTLAESWHARVHASLVSRCSVQENFDARACVCCRQTHSPYTVLSLQALVRSRVRREAAAACWGHHCIKMDTSNSEGHVRRHEGCNSQGWSVQQYRGPGNGRLHVFCFVMEMRVETTILHKTSFIDQTVRVVDTAWRIITCSSLRLLANVDD